MEMVELKKNKTSRQKNKIFFKCSYFHSILRIFYIKK